MLQALEVAFEEPAPGDLDGYAAVVAAERLFERRVRMFALK